MKRLNPPNYFLILLFLSILINFVFPIKKIILLPYSYLGIFFLVLGIILNLWTDRVFKQNKTTVKPNENPIKLITSGPFRISRNPMYLGMLFILLGAAILLGTTVTFIFPFVFFVVIEFLFIPMEERNLEKVFKNTYLDYKRKVRRWI